MCPHEKKKRKHTCTNPPTHPPTHQYPSNRPYTFSYDNIKAVTRSMNVEETRRGNTYVQPTHPPTHPPTHLLTLQSLHLHTPLSIRPSTHTTVVPLPRAHYTAARWKAPASSHVCNPAIHPPTYPSIHNPLLRIQPPTPHRSHPKNRPHTSGSISSFSPTSWWLDSTLHEMVTAASNGSIKKVNIRALFGNSCLILLLLLLGLLP